MRIEEILISGSCLYKIVVFKWTQFLENSGSSQLYTDEHDVARFISKEKKKTHFLNYRAQKLRLMIEILSEI